jgi:hypothetical protein
MPGAADPSAAPGPLPFRNKSRPRASSDDTQRGLHVIRKLAFTAVVGLLMAGCGATPEASVSPLWDGLSLLPIAEAVEREGLGIDCGPPGGGGGFSGQGPLGGGLVHHRASVTCTFPRGSLDRLAEPWGRLGGAYLESLGLRIAMPGSFDSGDNDVQGFNWEYTSGAWTGVLTISLVPVADDTYRVLANLVEYRPG